MCWLNELMNKWMNNEHKPYLLMLPWEKTLELTIHFCCAQRCVLWIGSSEMISRKSSGELLTQCCNVFTSEINGLAPVDLLCSVIGSSSEKLWPSSEWSKQNYTSVWGFSYPVVLPSHFLSQRSDQYHSLKALPTHSCFLFLYHS